MKYFKLKIAFLVLMIISCTPGIDDYDSYFDDAKILGTVFLANAHPSVGVYATIATPILEVCSKDNGTFCMHGEACQNDRIPLTISRDGYYPVTIDIEITGKVTYTGTIILYRDYTIRGD